MKINGLTVITVLFRILARDLASITEGTMTMMMVEDWVSEIQIPGSLMGQQCIKKATHKAEGKYGKVVGPATNLTQVPWP
jgi:hypothetical protein